MSSSGYVSASKIKQSLFRRLWPWLLLAALAGAAYLGRDTIKDTISDAFNSLADNSSVDPTPEQIADYFLYVMLPEGAQRNYYGSVNISPAELDYLRDVIIEFESYELKAEDVRLYFKDLTSGEDAFITANAEAMRANGTPEEEIAIYLVQKIDRERLVSRDVPANEPMPRSMIEGRLRSARLVEEYGNVSRAQAEELADKYDFLAPEFFQANADILNALTSTSRAGAQGLMSYHMARYSTVGRAGKDLGDGSYAEKIDIGRRFMDQKNQATNPVLRPGS